MISVTPSRRDGGTVVHLIELEALPQMTLPEPQWNNVKKLDKATSAIGGEAASPASRPGRHFAVQEDAI